MKNDKHIEELLRAEIEKTDVPASLGKEKIVEMLKEEKDFSDKTGNIIEIGAQRDSAQSRRTSAVALNRIATVAAAFVIVIACVVFATMNSGVRIIRTEPGFENYNPDNLIIGVSSYDEIEEAVKNALGKTENVTGSAIEPSGAVTVPSGVIGNTLLPNSSGAYVVDESEILDSAVNAYNLGGELIERVTGLEADIVKNNGEYIFIATTGTDAVNGGKVELIKVIRALPADEMAVASTIVLSDASDAGSIDECIELYLKGNRLVAIMSRNAYVMEDKAAYGKDSTVALYYDISDPEKPVAIREHIQDGKYLTSGISEQGSLYLITEKSVNASEKVSVPSCTVDGKEIKPDTNKIFMAVNDPGAAFTFITVTNVDDFSKAVDSLAFFGSNCGRLCVSGNAVLISRGFVSVEADENGSHSNLTEIYRFDIGDSAVSFSGSYAVNGTLRGKPFIDEKTGWMTVVAADSEAASLYVLNEKSEFISGLEGVFPKAEIKDVKFYGSNCYIVADDAAETTMIIDLSDPQKPKKGATVSSKGFAGRLFGADDELLIHIGGAEKGTGGILEDVSISLLGLSNPLKPENLDLYNLSGISDVTALIDSRSVMLVPDGDILGIPVVRTDDVSKESVIAYALFDYSDGDIKPLGFFNHDAESGGEKSLRGTCIGDIFYSISGNKIVAFSIDEETKLASVELN